MRMRFDGALLLLPVVLAACGHSHRSSPTVRPEEARLVSILAEVFDPATNLAWENVSVRIVEVDHEWSNSTWVNPVTEWFLTDGTGRVFFDEFLLADSQVGFREDDDGRAVLWPGRDEDEAWVVLEVDAVGFVPVLVEVPLRWAEPDVFVEIPFN